MLEPLNDYWKEITLRDYVCSNCWSSLIAYPMDNRKWLVVCRRCKDDTKGYVTKYYAETRQSESFGEKSETRVLLQNMGIIPNEHAGKPEEQIKQELGF